MKYTSKNKESIKNLATYILALKTFNENGTVSFETELKNTYPQYLAELNDYLKTLEEEIGDNSKDIRYYGAEVKRLTTMKPLLSILQSLREKGEADFKKEVLQAAYLQLKHEEGKQQKSEEIEKNIQQNPNNSCFAHFARQEGQTNDDIIAQSKIREKEHLEKKEFYGELVKLFAELMSELKINIIEQRYR